MKKIIITFISMLVVCTSAQAASNKLRNGVIMYKSGNYIGCLQTMKEVTASDPGNAFAHYYLAMSYVKVGKIENAKKEYNSVISLNSSYQLTSYAKTGLINIDPSAKTTSATAQGTSKETKSLPDANTLKSLPAVPAVSTSSSGVSANVDAKLKEQKLDSIKEIINTGSQVDPKLYKGLDNKKSDNTVPSSDEVKKAMAVLSQAGMNNYTNPYANADMMQLNMMMGASGGMNGMNGANNNYMSMLPMMLMQQSKSGQKIDPKLMETVVSSMMMPNMFSSLNSSNDNN